MYVQSLIPLWIAEAREGNAQNQWEAREADEEKSHPCARQLASAFDWFMLQLSATTTTAAATVCFSD